MHEQISSPKTSRYSRRSQLALEFVLLVGLSITMAMVLVIFMYDLQRDNLTEKIDVKMRDFGYSVHQELLTAYDMNPGYSRTFYLSDQIERTGYNVSILGNRTLLVQYGEKSLYYTIPFIGGSIQKGSNTIRNVDGNIYLN
jgi:hypothetical protein